MKFLVDTNILARTAQIGQPQSEAATKAVATLVAGGHPVCLAAQNLYEFWVVCTRPIEANGLGMSVKETRERLHELHAAFEVLDEVPGVRPIWEELVFRFEIMGKAAHDARLVATMKVHGLTHLLTFNKPDFARFHDLRVLGPEEILEGAFSP